MLGRACPLAHWRAFWQAFWRWRRDQVAIAALQALDARMLKDIGISRSEITSVVSGRGRDASRRLTPAPACIAGESGRAASDLPKLIPTPGG
jgi:uncharacterized protein YjiS (DUF1127 family)